MALGNPLPLLLSTVGDYEIERSLRFNSDDSAYLSRTPGSAGSATIFTVSFWVKDCTNGVTHRIFGGGSSYDTGNHDTSTYCSIRGDNSRLTFAGELSGTLKFKFHTNRALRDPSAWYHIVIQFDSTQGTDTNRMKVYINGIQETSFAELQYPAQNDEHRLTKQEIQKIGHTLSTTYHNGYLAEFHFLDGISTNAESFGETSANTGQWIPKEYKGSYGSQGYYLNFSDNSGTTATTLGKDSSGNSNNWTPNNFATGDAVKDTPTNNFATLMVAGTPKASGCSLKEANLEFETGTTGNGGNGNRLPFNTISPTSGKWYVEVMPTTTNEIFIGVHPYQVEIAPTSSATRWHGIYSADGNSYLASTSSTASSSTYAASYGNNDVIGIYMDMDASPPQVYFAKNGQWANGSGSWNQSTPTGAITLGGTFFTTSTGGFEGIGINIRSAASASSTSAQANFGQDSTFSGRIAAGGNVDASGIGDFKYAVPTGAKALCTANLPDPTITLPNKHFEARVYTGTGAGNTQTLTGFEFAPDMVWIKNRTSAYNHALYDTVRAASNRIYPNLSNAEASNAALSAFTSDGYTVGTDAANENAQVSWNWKGGGAASSNGNGSITASVSANTTAGFSIVSYSGNGTDGATVGHGLGVAPDCIIIKSRNLGTLGTAGAHWSVSHKGLTGGLNGGSSAKKVYLNLDNGESANSHGAVSAVSSTTFTLKTGSSNDTDAHVNDSSGTYIAYCFSSVEGYSKFGSYTGNGNADGAFIYTGFQPAWLMIKRADATQDWVLWDNKRDPYNYVGRELQPYTSDAELALSEDVDFVSNGFKARRSGTNFNGSGGTYIYFAFAESPFKYSNAR